MRHEVPWPGTGTRVNRDCLSTAAMISATLSRGTRSWTAIVDDAAPNRPESWATGETADALEGECRVEVALLGRLGVASG